MAQNVAHLLQCKEVGGGGGRQWEEWWRYTDFYVKHNREMARKRREGEKREEEKGEELSVIRS